MQRIDISMKQNRIYKFKYIKKKLKKMSTYFLIYENCVI